MAVIVKLSSSIVRRRIPNWFSVSVTAYFCSESQELESNRADYKAKIEFLKEKLDPDSLVSVLNIAPDLNSSISLFKWASLQKGFNHTTRTYKTIILKLGMSGNLEEMEAYCREMVSEKSDGLDESLLALIDSFVSNHRLSEALRVLHVMNSTSIKPSIGVFNSLMGALVEQKRDFKDVLFVYKEVIKAGIIPTIETLNCLLEALFKSGKVDLALDQYTRLNKKDCKPNLRTFQIMVSGLVASNRVEESVLILEENSVMDTSLGNAVLEACCGNDNLRLAQQVFDEMSEKNATDARSWNILIRHFCDYSKVNRALEYLCRMIRSSFEPDFATYSALILGFCKTGQVVGALKLFSFVRSKCWDLDSESYAEFVESLCQVEDIHQAVKVLRYASGRCCALQTTWFNSILRGLCNSRQEKPFLMLLSQMVVMGCAFDADTYCIIVQYMSSRNRTYECESNLMDLMQEKGSTICTERKDGNFSIQDNVSCILEEGLGNRCLERRNVW